MVATLWENVVINFKFRNAEEFEAAVAERLAPKEGEITELKAKIDELSKAKPAKETVDRFAAYKAEFPELYDLLGATDLHPTSLPCLAALEIWRGKKTASAIQAAIPTTPVTGERGGGETTLATVTKALKSLAAALILANRGIGLKMDTVRGSRAKGTGDTTVRLFRFQPIKEIDISEEAVSTDEQKEAA